ncbi:MAG: hypothetical protein KIT73_03145 [Burkholderiales bacterium]|nr:hypothetical protein [Burkholderiales bacterium]
MKRRTVWRSVAAAAALGFLIVMVVSGALPKQRALVKFEAKGVMQLAPERIGRAEIIAEGHRSVFIRQGEKAWSLEGGGPLPDALAARLSMAVQFMNTSGPVRVMKPDEYAGGDPAAYGFDRLTLAVALYEGDHRVLAAQFGSLNPEGYLQYMRVEGSADLYLMSRFVGAEWGAVARREAAPTEAPQDESER